LKIEVYIRITLFSEKGRIDREKWLAYLNRRVIGKLQKLALVWGPPIPRGNLPQMTLKTNEA
jgi:hypothetical protein